MRMLYVGQLSEGSTTLARKEALERRFGLEIVPFDMTPYFRLGSRIERSVLSRTNTGRGVYALNRALGPFARAHQYDAVWIDKGVLVYPETLAVLRNNSRLRFAIHYTPDAQILDNRSRHFLSAVPLYDLLVTTKSFEIEAYKTLGVRETLLVLQGYGQQFVPGGEGERGDPALRSEVCFIGHCQRHYAGRLKAVSSHFSGLRVWGDSCSGWPRYARFHPWARELVQGYGLWGARYPLALRSTKIALGLLSKRIPETTTTRTFEIPATGTFMLAERNEDHLSLFEEGREAEFFASDEELCDKIRFYLANNGAREPIARAGRERCIKSGYSEEHQLRRVLEQVTKLADVSMPFQLRV